MSSGVGTHIRIQSLCFNSSKSDVALHPFLTNLVIFSEEICFIICFPEFILFIFSASVSNPTTSNPLSANSIPRGTPTYPIPTIPIFALLSFIFAINSRSIIIW